jgi:hypothetical protein
MNGDEDVVDRRDKRSWRARSQHSSFSLIVIPPCHHLSPFFLRISGIRNQDQECNGKKSVDRN